MNIADPNLLEIIAKHIDDKETFHSFAISSKKCSNIARKLTPIKKFEFKHINFVGFELLLYMWDGCYTKGIISYEKTRIWFYPRGLEVVYDFGVEIKDYNNNFELSDFLSENGHLLEDSCQLIESSLDAIINTLKNGGNDACHFPANSNEELKNLKRTYYDIERKVGLEEFINSIKNEKLMIDYGAGDNDILTIWIIRNLQAVIEELEKVSMLRYTCPLSDEWE